MEKLRYSTSKIFHFGRRAEPHQKTRTSVGQAEIWRKLQRDAVAKRPAHCGRKVVGRILPPETGTRAQASIHLYPRLNVVEAEVAMAKSGRAAKRSIETYCVAELIRLVPDVLFDYQVPGDCPILEGTVENQPTLDGPL